MEKKQTTKGPLAIAVKKPSGNYLFFRTRARSRSFTTLSDLFTDDEASSNQDLDCITFGVDETGTSFKFQPSDSSILKSYTEVKLLFEEILSPTVVSLMASTEDGKAVIKKSLVKSKCILSEKVNEFCRRECAIHSQMKHPNIIELYDYTEDDQELALFMEHANKPMYLTQLINDEHTPVEDEHLLRKIAEDILKGLAYIHSRNLIHGDVKLCNMLCHEENDVITVKICDFGLSYILGQEKEGKVLIEDVSGTLGHIAPEVKSHCWIGTEVDMWCFGLMLYELAVAYKPTQLKNFAYSSGDIPFRRYDWKRKSPLLQDLILKCMDYNPEKRISAEEALQHPWFSSQEE
ncbi:unnamed protein product [Moneuplotes crassus]|uniref:Protein kinase domain-containing protein n=1 Tax=Euplotes crassus TaxID=5936 RepID=A0AAD1UJ08_EUPCR|nr:unnamed protein product [Moneuplotes crassus]